MLVLKNVRERFRAKIYHPVSLLLSVFSKVFKKLVSNKYLDLLEKCGLFSDFQYGFWSTAGLLTVCLSDKITRAFNKSGAIRPVTLDISMAFDRVWHADLLHNLKSYRISGLFNALFRLCTVMGSFEWF